MKRRKSRLLDYFVYVVVRTVVAVAQMMSIRQCYAFADRLAGVMYRVDKKHRHVAMENLRLAFGAEYSESERDRIVRDVYQHFCRMVMEMLTIPRQFHLTNWRERVRLVGHADVLNTFLDGGPIILLSGHFGNWEMAGYLFGLFGFPSASVARTLDNPYLDQFLRKFREKAGQTLIPKKGGYEQMLEVLKGGAILSFLADQDAGERGLFVDFFGRPASTHKAIALLAIEHKAPVVVGYARRLGNEFQYEVGCEAIIRPEELTGTAEDVRLVTQRYTSALERAIRRSPEQYLWLHRRWKHQPKVRTKGPHQAKGASQSLQQVDGAT